MAIIKATSPAANSSPIAMDAIIAIEMSNAEEILLMPLLLTILVRARYRSGKPQIATVTHAGSTGNEIFVSISTRLIARKNPPIKVDFQLEKVTQTLFAT
jgi:hypothetical protein